MKYLNFGITIWVIFISLNGWCQNGNWDYYKSPEQVNDFLELGNNLWLATNDGVVTIDRNTLQKTYYTPRNSTIPSSTVESIIADGPNSVWIGTYDNRIAHFNGNTWTDVPIPQHLVGSSENGLYSIAKDQSNNIFVAHDHGLLKYNGYWTKYPIPDSLGGLPNVESPVWDVQVAADGTVYLASNRLLKFDGIQFEAVSPSNLMSLYFRGRSYLDSNEDLWWVYGSGSIVKIQGQNHKVYDEIAAHDVRLAEDSQGQFWVIDPSNTIFKLSQDSFIVQSTPSSHLSFNNTNGLFITSDDQLWTTRNSKLTKLAINNYQEIELSPNFTVSPKEFNELFCGPDGTIYTSFGDQLCSFNNGQWKVQDTPEMRLLYSLKAMAFFSSGEKYLLEGSTVLENNGSGWQQASLTKPDGSPLIQVIDLVKGLNDELVFICHYGIGKYKNGITTYLTVPASMAPFHENLNDIEVSSNGDLWVHWNHYGNSIDKLGKFDGNAWSVIDLEQEFGYETYTKGIFIDAQDKVWLRANHTLRVFDGQSWQVYSRSTTPGIDEGTFQQMWEFDNDIYVRTIYGFVKFDGSSWSTANTTGWPIEGTILQAATMDNSGNLWMYEHTGGLHVMEVDQVTSSNIDVLNATQLTIYPNPATDILNVDFPREPVQSIRVFNAAGQLMNGLSFSLSSRNSATLDVSKLETGFYFIEFQTIKATYVNRFVISNN